MIKLILSLSALVFAIGCSDSNQQQETGHVASSSLATLILGNWHSGCQGQAETQMVFNADNTLQYNHLKFSDNACANLSQTTQFTQSGNDEKYNFEAQGQGKKARGMLKVTTIDSKSGKGTDDYRVVSIINGTAGLELWLQKKDETGADTFYR